MWELSNYKLNQAFTLVELLVTVAILGILAGLAVANYDVYKDSAYHAELTNYSRNAVTAGNAGLLDGRFGNYRNPFSEEQFDYRIKFPGLELPSYIGFVGNMHNIGMGAANSPKFYFGMFNCKKKRFANGFAFGSDAASTSFVPMSPVIGLSNFDSYVWSNNAGCY